MKVLKSRRSEGLTASMLLLAAVVLVAATVLTYLIH
jgi:hypothetical protein